MSKKGYTKTRGCALSGDDDNKIDGGVVAEELEEESVSDEVEFVDPTNLPRKKCKPPVIGATNMLDKPVIVPQIQGSSMQARQGGNLAPGVQHNTTFWEKNRQPVNSMNNRQNMRPVRSGVPRGARGK